MKISDLTASATIHYGHGHNYMVEVTVSGPVDPETGMIANLADLDSFVQREVLDAFDHTYLNGQVPAFREMVPTTENVAREIFRRLEKFPSAAAGAHQNSGNQLE